MWHIKCLTWSVGRVVEVVVSAAINGTLLEISHLVHVLQVFKRTLVGKTRLYV